jgi:hypothetical protein
MKKSLMQGFSVKFLAFLSATVLIITALLLQIPVFAASTFAPYQYDLVSVNNVDGQGLNGSGDPWGISFDGSRILFQSGASNLPQSGANQALYLRDMAAGTTVRADLSTTGVVPDKETSGGVLSTTGRYMAFSSTASNIIDGTTYDNSVNRAYFKDLQTGVVEALTPFSGLQVQIPVNLRYNAAFAPVSVSDDGRFVFISTIYIDALVPNTRHTTTAAVKYQNALYWDLAMYDRQNATWSLVNKPSGPLQNYGTFGYGTTTMGVSCDGALAVFSTQATNMTSSYTGSGAHVYLADLRNGLKITDLTPGGVGDSADPEISCNGRYVIYSTRDRTLISPTPTGMNSYAHLVRYDRFTGERIYIDSNSAGTAYDGFQAESIPSTVSNDGDVLMVTAPNTSAAGRTIKFKHLSDSSGTVEEIQASPYPNVWSNTGGRSGFVISADGSYVSAASKDGYLIGLLSNPSSVYNTIRVKTGL